MRPRRWPRLKGNLLAGVGPAGITRPDEDPRADAEAPHPLQAPLAETVIIYPAPSPSDWRRVMGLATSRHDPLAW